MPRSYIETNFDEKSGFIPSNTEWGSWWQTVNEVHIEVDVPPGTKASAIKVLIKPRQITVNVSNKLIIQGELFSIVKEDESIWTLEDRKKINIVLIKADPITSETIWEGLLKNQYFADALTLHEMRKKLDLEKFQIENPGFDFSNAKLAKCYDKLPHKKMDEEEEAR